MNWVFSLFLIWLLVEGGVCQQEAGFFWNPTGDEKLGGEDLLCADPRDSTQLLVVTGKRCEESNAITLTSKDDCNNKAIQMSKFFGQQIHKLSEGPVVIPSSISALYPKGCWIRLAGPDLQPTPSPPTVTATQIPPIEPPQEEDDQAVKDLTTAASTAASVGALASGSVMGGGQGAKLKNFMKLTSCPPDTDSQDMDFLDSPTGLGRRGKGTGVGNSSAMQRRREMMLGNIATVSAILLFHLILVCVCYIYKKARSRPATFEKCLAIMRFPSFSIFPFLILFQPITTPAFTLLYHEHTLLDVVICSFAFVFVGVAAYLMMRCIRDAVFCCTLEEDLFSKDWKKWCFGEYIWTSKNADANRYERRFALIFKDFTDQYKRFIMADIVVLFIISMVSGLIPTTKLQCAGQAIVMSLVEILFFLIVCRLQPFLAKLDHYHILAVTALQVGGLLCALCTILELHEKFSSASRVLFLASTALIILKSLLDIIVWLYERWHTWYNRRRARKEASRKVSMIEPLSVTTIPSQERRGCESTYSNDDPPVGDFSNILSPKNNILSTSLNDDDSQTPVMMTPVATPKGAHSVNRSFCAPPSVNSRRETPKMRSRPPSTQRSWREPTSMRLDRPRRESTARIDLDVQLLLQSATV
eukprot:TRINITY_DN16421_c0_g1_i1.p1 TRINITY_DN16421_c0_g1~~TRINITY_DN16421_c0_g1_i1.p1  ORF type:complete len:643 (+),score=88.63 TRINITY_DN16421_c0_g1_i1:52-1980(+)